MFKLAALLVVGQVFKAWANRVHLRSKLQYSVFAYLQENTAISLLEISVFHYICGKKLQKLIRQWVIVGIRYLMKIPTCVHNFYYVIELSNHWIGLWISTGFLLCALGHSSTLTSHCSTKFYGIWTTVREQLNPCCPITASTDWLNKTISKYREEAAINNVATASSWTFCKMSYLGMNFLGFFLSMTFVIWKEMQHSGYRHRLAGMSTHWKFLVTTL